MTYAAAGRHHYNFQTSDEIASPPFFSSPCCSRLDQSLRGVAVRNSMDEVDALGPCSFASIFVRRDRGRSAGPSGVSSHLLHACSQQWPDGVKRHKVPGYSSSSTQSTPKSCGIRHPEATKFSVNRSQSMLPTLRTRQKLIQPPEKLGQAENIWSLCMKFHRI